MEKIESVVKRCKNCKHELVYSEQYSVWVSKENTLAMCLERPDFPALGHELEVQ